MSSETDKFKTYLSPCLKGFKQKKGTWFFYQHGELSDKNIQATIDGKVTIGFRFQEQTSAFGLDLDDR